MPTLVAADVSMSQGRQDFSAKAHFWDLPGEATDNARQAINRRSACRLPQHWDKCCRGLFERAHQINQATRLRVCRPREVAADRSTWACRLPMKPMRLEAAARARPFLDAHQLFLTCINTAAIAY